MRVMVHDAEWNVQGMLQELASAKSDLETTKILMLHQSSVLEEKENQARLCTSKAPAW